MFKHFRKVSAVAAVSALAAAGMAGTALATPQTQEEPDVNACSAVLEHPPILDSDHTDSDQPIVRDGVGKIPVVLVHGWTARGHHADEGGNGDVQGDHGAAALGNSEGGQQVLR